MPLIHTLSTSGNWLIYESDEIVATIFFKEGLILQQIYVSFPRAADSNFHGTSSSVWKQKALNVSNALSGF